MINVVFYIHLEKQIFELDPWTFKIILVIVKWYAIKLLTIDYPTDISDLNSVSFILYSFKYKNKRKQNLLIYYNNNNNVNDNTNDQTTIALMKIEYNDKLYFNKIV